MIIDIRHKMIYNDNIYIIIKGGVQLGTYKGRII